MTTGEGGMVTTDDADVAAQARMLRNHGQSERYLHERIGFNWRMTDLAAAIGLAQLDRLEEGNARRRANARRLNKGCTGVVDAGGTGMQPSRVSPVHGPCPGTTG